MAATGIKDLVRKLLSVDVVNLNTKRFGDVYDVLNSQEIKYTALVVELMNMGISEPLDRIVVRMSVIDKLNENESNTLDVFDHCNRVLHDILLKCDEIGLEHETEYSVDFVKQDFADKCGGVYADITFNMENNGCEYYE